MSGPNCDQIEYSVFPAITNQYGPCSGHGTCVNGTCICDEGWTGLSDWVNTDGVDCQINDVTVRCLWGVLLLACLYMQGVSATRIHQRYQDFRGYQRLQRERGRRAKLRENRGLIAALTHSFITFPCIVIYSIIRIAKPDERVGITVTASVFFFVTKAAFYFSGWAFQPALLASILQGQKYGRKRIEQLVRLNNRINFGLMIMSCITGVYAFLPLFTENDKVDETAKIALLLYYLTMTLTLMFWGFTFKYVEKQVDEVLTASYASTKNERTEQIRQKLVEMQSENFRQAVIQTIIYGVFLFYPFLWNKHDYFHPISWIAIALLGKKMAFTTIKRKGSSSRDASKQTEGTGSFDDSHTIKNAYGGSSMIVVGSDEDEYV